MTRFNTGKMLLALATGTAVLMLAGSPAWARDGGRGGGRGGEYATVDRGHGDRGGNWGGHDGNRGGDWNRGDRGHRGGDRDGHHGNWDRDDWRGHGGYYYGGYYAPRAVYYTPSYYYAPACNYYPAPVYYTPCRPVYYGGGVSLNFVWR
jgi:hypothetical protein